MIEPKENLSHDCNDFGSSVVIVTDEQKRNQIGTAGPPQVAISQTLLGRNAVDCSVRIDRFRWLHCWRGRTRQGSVEAFRSVEGHECLGRALQLYAETVGDR